MSHNNPPARNAVLAALKKHGPMTARALADVLDWTVERAHRTVINTRRLRPGQLIRVIGFERVTEGKGKDMQIYAAQAGEDVKRTAVHERRRRLATQARYRERHRAAINARHRASRQKKSGKPLVQNIWSPLAPKEIQQAMSAAANDYFRKQA